MKKVLIYFICVSFLLMMNGFPKTFAETKEKLLPIGEMVSKGEVEFEARQNVWKGVESSYFPIFQGTKIKIEDGMASLTLSNNSQIQVNPNSVFFFDQIDRFVLSQGGIEFRIPSTSEMNFKVGNLFILKSQTLQAAKGASVVRPSEEETSGSISIHPNGAVTVKSLKGKLTVLNQDRVVLAALSSKDSVTIPSITVGGKPPVKVAQAGKTDVGAETGTSLGMFGENLASLWVVAGMVGLVGTIWAIHEIREDHDHEPVCP